MENTDNKIDNNSTVKLDNKERAYATGKRKNSIARVWLKRGSGSISVNGKTVDKYFARPVLQMIVNQPLNIVDGEGVYEIMATVKGGGLSGQAGAIRHGISKALSLYDSSLRPALKKVGFIIIPIATTISSWINSILLFIFLKKDNFFNFNSDFISKLFKILLSSIFMGVFIYYLIVFFKTNLAYDQSFKSVFLIGIVVAGFICYLLIAFFIKAFKISDINLKY